MYEVILCDEFEVEFDGLPRGVQKAIASRMALLAEVGPELGRPYADTLTGSRHPRMKELRLTAESGVWRVLYAFDPKRRAILLVAGDKKGQNQKRFYPGLIRKADMRYDAHLVRMESG